MGRAKELAENVSGEEKNTVRLHINIVNSLASTYDREHNSNSNPFNETLK